MFCHNCGGELEEGAAFCSHCGAVVHGMEQDAAQARAASTGTGTEAQAASASAGTGTEAQVMLPAAETGKPSKKTSGKGKAAVIAVILSVLVLAVGAAGSIVYFTGDGYVSRKNMKLAEECFEEERYGEALDFCEAALDRDPALTDAYLMSADILLSEEKYREAARILEKGLKRAGDDRKSRELLEEKLDEVNRAETAAVPRLLQEYLDQELVPQFGSAELGSRVREFEMDLLNSSGGYEGNRNWTGNAGIVSSRICDWDDDGREELLAIVLDGVEMRLCVYEVEDNEVVEKSECGEEREDDLTGCDETWYFLDGESGKYMICARECWSILGDGSYETVHLYQYGGENLYTPLVVEKAWGSSENVYRAWRYDGDGEQLSEEILYDEFGGYGSAYDWEHFSIRLTELFAECGIELDYEEGIQAVDGMEELVKLNMWGDYRNYHQGEDSWCDTVVYHFNDWDSPLQAYGRFLRGEETVRMREDAWYCGDRHENWTFQDILAEVQKEYLSYSDHGVSRVEYAFMDCGDDGVEEMQLKFVGLDIYDQGDDSDLTMVISCRDGQLEVVYTCESWARSVTEIDYYGCIDSFGSAGAGDHLFGMEYINGNGDVQSVYEGEDLMGWWASYVSGTAYNTAFSGYYGADPEIEVVRYTINGEDYYVLYADESVWENQYFKTLCEEEGIRFVQEAEVEILAGQRMSELGIKQSWETGKGLYWNYWFSE